MTNRNHSLRLMIVSVEYSAMGNKFAHLTNGLCKSSGANSTLDDTKFGHKCKKIKGNG